MPAAHNPHSPEYYVYRIEANSVPFYVGVGRSSRASDRVRYVTRQMHRESEGHIVNWVLSNEVVALCLRKGLKVKVRYTCKGLNREAALLRERRSISALLSRRYILANLQHNPYGPRSASSIMLSILQRCGNDV